MIGLLLNFLILIIVLGTIWYIITLLPIPSPFMQTTRVVVAVIAIIAVLYLLMAMVGTGHFPMAFR